MKLSFLRTAAFVLAVMALLPACESLHAQFIGPAPTSSAGLNEPYELTTDPAILYPANRELVLQPGDLMIVTVYGVQPAYTVTGRLSLDGSINLPLAGVIRLGGMPLSAAEAALASRLEDLGMYRQPQIVIQVTEGPSHVVTVIGGAKDQVIPILGPKRLFDVLATGGGLGPEYSSRVIIDRPGLDKPIIVSLGSDPAHSAAADIPVFAGDTINIGAVGRYFIMGAVKAPGTEKLNGILPTTALQALAASGGGMYASRLNNARLIRTVGSQRSVVEIQLKKILNGEVPDPILQSEDIIYVPTNRFKQALSLTGVTTVLSLALTAIAVTRY